MKQLEKDKDKMSQEEYLRAVDDANRKRDEQDWRWRLFYERFAQQ